MAHVQTQVLLALMRQVNRYLLSLGATRQDAEDVTQEALIKVLSYIDVVAESEFRAIAFKIGLNRYYDLCRKQRRNVTITLDERVLAALTQHVPSAESTAMANERWNELQRVLNTLPVTKKHLLFMKYDLGMTYEEIATLTGTSLAAVKTNLYRARNQFKTLMLEEEYRDE